MIKRYMLKEYLTYVIPTMLTFTLTCIYSIIDGIFVGNFVGDAGLAGVNVAFPLVTLIMAIGTGIGIGGAVIASIELGRGSTEKNQRAYGNTFLMMLISAVPVMALLLALPHQLCELLGGRGETLEQATAYISVIAWGAPFQIIATGCLPLIRNRGRVGYAMFTSVVGGVMNVALDFAFVVVVPWGVSGAALATVISQVTASLLCLAFFLKKENRIPRRCLRLDARTSLHTLKLGLAPFGLTILPEATVVAINVNAGTYGGEVAIAAYAVIAYVANVIQVLIQSVGDGSQPLISKHYGAGEHDTVRRLRNTNYSITISIGALGLFATYLLRDQIPLVFGASPETAAMIAHALPIFSIAYLFYGFTHASTSFFYAVDDARASTTVVYGEACLIVVCVFGAGYLLGLEGIWLSVTFVQMLLSVIGVFLLRANRKRTLKQVEKA